MYNVAEATTYVIVYFRPLGQSFLIKRYHGNANKAQNTSEIVALIEYHASADTNPFA